MVAPPLGKAGLGGGVLCRGGVLLLGCCGAGGPAPPVLAPVLGGVRLGICNLLGCCGAGACCSLFFKC